MLIESQTVDHGTCHEGTFAFCADGVLPSSSKIRFFGVIELFPHSVAFVEKETNGMDLSCQNSYMRSVDNDELFQGLFIPKEILADMDRLLRCDQCCLYLSTDALLTKSLLVWVNNMQKIVCSYLCVCVCVFTEEMCCFIFF